MKNRLRDLREDDTYTQKYISEILSTSQSNYSRWENGIENIPLDKLKALCKFFDCSMDYILYLTNVKSKAISYEYTNKNIGDKIKNFRRRNKLSQYDLAIILNTSQSTISAYESGKTTLLLEFCHIICNEYNLSIDWFYCS